MIVNESNEVVESGNHDVCLLLSVDVHARNDAHADVSHLNHGRIVLPIAHRHDFRLHVFPRNRANLRFLLWRHATYDNKLCPLDQVDKHALHVGVFFPKDKALAVKAQQVKLLSVVCVIRRAYFLFELRT